MDTPQLIRLNDSSAIRIGRVWVRSVELADSLARFTRLVFCLTDSEAHPYSLRGSSASVKWRGYHLSFLCGHQISGFTPAQVVVPIDRDGKILVSCSTFMEMIPKDGYDGEEFGDLRAMYFRPEDYKQANLERAFFELIEGDLWKGDRDSTFIIYGYPTSLRNLEHSEPSYALSHIRVGQTVTAAKYVGPSSAIGVHVLEMQKTGDYSIDGLSGGAVFQLGQDAQGFFCGFAGIILRGSDTSNFVHFLESRVLMQFMGRIASEHQQS